MIKGDDLDIPTALRRWPALLSLLKLPKSGWR